MKVLTIGQHPLLKEIEKQFNRGIANNRSIVRGHAICDDTNNSFGSINRDAEIHIDQYLQPIIPAKFIQVNIAVTHGGCDVRLG